MKINQARIELERRFVARHQPWRFIDELDTRRPDREPAKAGRSGLVKGVWAVKRDRMDTAELAGRSHIRPGNARVVHVDAEIPARDHGNRQCFWLPGHYFHMAYVAVTVEVRIHEGKSEIN